MAGDRARRDTIAAIATPPGRGGIGVVRVSGPGVPEIAAVVAGGLPRPRAASLRTFVDAGGVAVDQGIALYFPAPHSYTGEDVLELQGHGGATVMQAVLTACLDAGARIAEPGEFTKRAFLEGKVDLAQAEAVADLIDASSQQAVRSALRSLTGEFSHQISLLNEALLSLRSLTEAMLDFPEDEVDDVHRDEALKRVQGLCVQLESTIQASRQGSLLRTGIHVVIAGAPNVGKSSLLNRLAGEERAIVTAIAGTTRDALREPVEIDGVPLVLVDTAGLRVTTDAVEQIGIERTRREIERADIVLLVSDASAPHEVTGPISTCARQLRVFNKVDLTPDFVAPSGAIAVSAKTGKGLHAMCKAILECAGWAPAGESLFTARERHLRALSFARDRLVAAESRLPTWELFAEELRLAHKSLGSITGEVDAEELLGEIFSRFCIGK